MSVEENAERQKAELVNPARRREIIEHSLAFLPHGATREDRSRAQRLAREAVLECGPQATELDIMKASDDAIAGVATDCLRQVRLEKWFAALPHMLPYGASINEIQDAKEVVRKLMEELSIDLPDFEVTSRVENELAALRQEIQLRIAKQKLIESGRAHVAHFLSELYLQDTISSEERSNSKLQKDLERAVGRKLHEEINGEETPEEVQEIVEEIVAEELDLEWADLEDEED